MSGERNRSISESLVLDDTSGGVVIAGITDDKIAAKSGLQAGDEIVAATIHLDHLNKNEVLDILKVLEPYDNNMKVLTKKELNPSAGLGPLGLDLKSPSEMLGLKKDLSLDTKANAPVVSLNGLDGDIKAGQGFGGDISGPTLNGDLPSLSLSKPSTDTGANFALPSLGLTGSDIKGDLDGAFKAPDVRVSTPQLNTPSIDIDKPEIKTGDAKFNTPKFSMPSLGLTGSDVKGDLDGAFKAPDVRVSTPQLNTPSIDIDKPEIKTGDAKFEPTKFSMPTFSGPHIKSPNANADISGDLNLKTPDLSVSRPDLNPQLDLKTSDLKLETPNVDLDAPSGKIKWPHHTWKGPKIKSPKADVNAPDVNLSTPKIDGDLDINLPKAGIKGPDVDVRAPDIDAEAPSGKWSWLPWNWNKPKISGPTADLDIDANKPDLNLSAPKIDGEINGPDLSLPKGDLKSPGIDVDGPDLDIDPPSSKFTWPHKKWKKPVIHGPKADLNADLNTPDLSVPRIDGEINGPDLRLPKGDLKSPSIDVDGPDLDIDPPSSKFAWPHKKWKKPVIHGPKADLNADLNTPDLSVPKIDGEINGPDLSLPKGDLKCPGIDVDGPDLDIDPPSSKFTWPHKKWKTDLNADLNTPDLSLPKIDGKLNGPNADLSLPKGDLDVNVPDANIDAPSGKIRFPTLKKFKLSGPKVNTPDVDLDAKAPDLSLSTPTLDVPDVDVKAPNADIDAPSGKIKFPTLKKPKWSLSGPKVNGPDVDLDADVSAPDLSLKAPKIDADLKAPDANLDINGPDVEGPSGFFKGFKLPKIGTLKGPKAGIDADVDAPKLDLKTPDLDLKTPDGNLSGPKIDGGIGTPDLDVSLPSANLRSPNVDVDCPDVNLDAPDGGFKFSKIKLPKFKGPKVKGPDVDANLDAPDINLDLPRADLDAPDLSLSGPKIKGGVETPDLDVSGSKPGFKLPSFNIGGSKAQLPDADLKAPTIKGDLNAPNLNLDTNLKAPEANFSLPNADLNLPKADLKAPDAQLKTPSVDLDSKRGDFKLPTFKLPKFGASEPKVEVPSVNSGIEGVNIAAPSVDLSGPKVGADIGSPNVDLKAPTIDANVEKSKLPHFSFPKFNLSGKSPEVDPSANLDVSSDLKLKAPSVDGGIGTSGVSLSGPGVNTSLNKPNVGISADTDADIKGSPKSKLKSLFRWGRKSSSDDEGLNVRSEVDAPKADLDVPAGLGFKFHKLPDAAIDVSGGSDGDLGLPKLDSEAKDYVMSKGVRLPIINTTSKSGEKVDIFERLRMAKEKVPSANVSPTDSRGEIDLKLPTTSLGLNASAEGADSSLVRGGTFKVEKPDSVLDLAAPTISTSDDNEKMSLSLSNMLCLDTKDSD